MKGCKFFINGMILYESKALFAPGIFVFNIFSSKLEEDT